MKALYRLYYPFRDNFFKKVKTRFGYIEVRAKAKLIILFWDFDLKVPVGNFMVEPDQSQDILDQREEMTGIKDLWGKQYSNKTPYNKLIKTNAAGREGEPLDWFDLKSQYGYYDLLSVLGKI